MATKSKQIIASIEFGSSEGFSSSDVLGCFYYWQNLVVLNQDNPFVAQAKKKRNSLAVIAITAHVLSGWALDDIEQAIKVFGDYEGPEEFYTMVTSQLEQANISWN